MRLRSRLALALALLASVAVALAFAVTLTAFRHAQERQLDLALLVRAQHRADLIARLGEHALHLDVTPPHGPGDLDYLIQYSAVYRIDGSVVEATPNLGLPPPTLGELGMDPTQAVPQQGLEFVRRGQVLRAVLVRVDFVSGPGQRLLLLAAPRGDVDADVAHLVRLMLLVLLGLCAATLGAGWLLGRYLARDIEGIAQVTRRVSEGELGARVQSLSTMGAQETRALARDLNQMIDRITSLFAANRRFISHAAHELRSPLAALRGELELALRRPREGEGYRAAIATALDDTNRLVSLAEDLLLLARLEGAPGREQARSVPLSELIEDAARMAGTSLGGEPPAEDGAPRVVVSAAEAAVVGTRSDLQRMLRNLLDNAIGHAPPGSKVQVQAEVADGQARIAVRDEGPGVPKELRERIFEPFFRGEAEREHSGAGLGLSIAREIARRHGGDLVLVPTERGACFMATLPLAR
jgi:two-component system heavy metal sensor histidine kinase CusS